MITRLLTAIQSALEYLGGVSEEPPRWWFGGMQAAAVWGIWWAVLILLIILFSGQASKFIYIDF